MLSVLATPNGADARFGFIVTRKVGNAVTRNRIRRRLKAIARELVDGGLVGMDVVVRAAPGVVDAKWADLRSALRDSLIGKAPE